MLTVKPERLTSNHKAIRTRKGKNAEQYNYLVSEAEEADTTTPKGNRGLDRMLSWQAILGSRIATMKSYGQGQQQQQEK